MTRINIKISVMAVKAPLFAGVDHSSNPWLNRRHLE